MVDAWRPNSGKIATLLSQSYPFSMPQESEDESVKKLHVKEIKKVAKSYEFIEKTHCFPLNTTRENNMVVDIATYQGHY